MGETALVLSGGGSRGAYQAGCWRALDEAGVDPDLVVGTSVGALNGLLIAQRAPWQDLWALWGRLRQRDVLRVRRDVWRVWRWRGVYDATPMRRLVDAHLDPQALHRGRRLIVCAVDLQAGEHVTFGGQELRAEHLMASTALVPGMPPVTIGGRPFADGGIAQNPPLEPALASGATRIYGLLHDPIAGHPGPARSQRELIWRVSDIYWHYRLQTDLALFRARQGLPTAHPDHLTRVEATWLAPSRALGTDMLHFDPREARGLLRQGYEETQERL